MQGDEFKGNNDNNEENEEEEDEEEDEETVEMFNEISKGKSTITVKQLLKWDEIQELISSELMSADVIATYIKRLQLKDNKLTLEDFKRFIALLDEVLVDESGNILGEGGIDLGGDDDDDEDE